MALSAWRSSALAICVAVSCAQPMAAEVVPGDAARDGFMRRLIELINRYRESQGLETLSPADHLAALANEHSADMSARRQLSHEGFRGRLVRSNRRLCVENVGWNHRTPEALFDGWVRSPSHHRNLLEPKVARVGIGIDARYVTFFACD